MVIVERCWCIINFAIGGIIWKILMVAKDIGIKVTKSLIN